MRKEIELLIEVVGSCGHHVRAPIGRIELNCLARLRHDLLGRYRRFVEAVDQSDDREPSDLPASPSTLGIDGDRLAQDSRALPKLSCVQRYI